jgi:hypothetical protein
VGTKRWASLEKPMQTVLEATCAEGQQRDPEPRAAWVVFVDGDHTPIDSVAQAAKASGVRVVMILDIMPVLAYLWKAATALCDPEDPTAAQGVGDTSAQLLQGQANSIVRSVRLNETLQGWSATQREPMEPCATSVAHHAPSLNSPHSLATGYPMATGVIEGACRYLGKDRMEMTGARWGLEGGEAVLTLRALSINGAFDASWDCHENQEYQRNHQAKCSEMPNTQAPLQLMSGGKYP